MESKESHDVDDEIIEKLLNKGDVDINSFIKGLKQTKISSIVETINEINELIDERKELSKAILSEIDKINSTIESALIQLSTNENISEQLKMRQKQIEIEELKLKERLDCWRDIALLKRELRERLREERKKEKKIDVFDELSE